ncbi:MAG: glycosyltransferase family 2 protein [Vicinamibacterales bacterium]
MRISVVVPAYNEERLLGESLRRIRAAAAGFERRGWAWESIVCDNNSSDRTAEIARAAGATAVFEPVNQIARARNAGAAVATGWRDMLRMAWRSVLSPRRALRSADACYAWYDGRR